MLLTMIMFLVGCQGLGLPTAKTFNERLATGYSTVTVVLDTATTLHKGGKLSTSDAQNVLEQATSVKSALDIARSLRIVAPEAANNKLEVTLVMLLELQKYLEASK